MTKVTTIITILIIMMTSMTYQRHGGRPRHVRCPATFTPIQTAPDAVGLTRLACPPPARDPTAPTANNVVNWLSDYSSHPSLAFVEYVPTRFAERRVLSSIADTVPWRRHRVIDVVEAERNVCRSVEPNLTADADIAMTEKAERGLFKANDQVKAERQLLETYAQPFATRCNSCTVPL